MNTTIVRSAKYWVLLYLQKDFESKIREESSNKYFGMKYYILEYPFRVNSSERNIKPPIVFKEIVRVKIWEHKDELIPVCCR